MAKLNRKQTQDRAREILEVESGGIRWGEILKHIYDFYPETWIGAQRGTPPRVF